MPYTWQLRRKMKSKIIRVVINVSSYSFFFLSLSLSNYSFLTGLFLRMTKVLIDHTAELTNIPTIDDRLMTPLHLACVNDDTAVAKALLDKVRNCYRGIWCQLRIVLQFILYSSFIFLLSFLIFFSARARTSSNTLSDLPFQGLCDIHMINERGHTPLAVAATTNSHGIVALLIKRYELEEEGETGNNRRTSEGVSNGVYVPYVPAFIRNRWTPTL